MTRTHLLWLLLAGFVVGACLIDDYYVDELTVTLEAPLDALEIDEGGVIEGNQSAFFCGPLPEGDIVAEFEGQGPHEAEVHTESADQRTHVALRAWHDADGDGVAGCDELGVTVVVDMDETREITLPLPDDPPEPGGAGCAGDDDDSAGDDDSAR